MGVAPGSALSAANNHGRRLAARRRAALWGCGADPFLARCLDGLLRQDYPSYEIRIVVDSPADPAWEIVREVLAKPACADVKVALLERRLETCSLKVSALLQALDGLDDSCQAVALIDADATPRTHWLRDLAAPLRDPKVGATSGVRWYITDSPQWGSLVRMAWGAAAAAQMVAFGIPWGGSMAFSAPICWQRSNIQRRMGEMFVRGRAPRRSSSPVGSAARLCTSGDDGELREHRPETLFPVHSPANGQRPALLRLLAPAAGVRPRFAPGAYFCRRRRWGRPRIPRLFGGGDGRGGASVLLNRLVYGYPLDRRGSSEIWPGVTAKRCRSCRTRRCLPCP